jgi:starch phosphorylase
MSLIEEGEDKKVRMAHLAVAGSHAVNGVSVLHSELVRKELVPDFFSLWPDRFLNVTNGVTQRRWLLQANPDLADLISQAVGPKWIVSLDALADLAGFAEDRPFQDALARVKRNNKERLCRFVAKATGLSPDPESLFDVQAKRIHEYKRQLLKLLHIIHEYVMFAEEGRAPAVARTFLFAGKAAPGYWQARQIIKLIHSVAETLRRDSRVNPWLKVVFLPDYRVSLAEVLIPAADLSEQISTAGTEASGTGNMKFALNGALTVGTLDGANIEIREAVGNENFYAFGLSASAVQRMRAEGSYRPEELYAKDPVIRRVMDVFKGDRFCPGEPGLFRWVYERLLTEGDPFFHLADFRDYLAASDRVLKDFLDPSLWHARVVRNLAGMGPFSSDRAVAEYARTIWGIGG